MQARAGGGSGCLVCPEPPVGEPGASLVVFHDVGVLTDKLFPVVEAMQKHFSAGLTGLIFLLSKGLSRVFSNTIQKNQLFGTQPSLWFNFHIHT
uniref:Uncharacterized protein n=1 Tax=Bos indicus x Bos taurus TaxID=30522 RepID=A0A4W2DLE2_BOBOX